MGAWIEISASLHSVAPLVGAWIEIRIYAALGDTNPVAPLVGAWIEIFCGWNRIYG